MLNHLIAHTPILDGVSACLLGAQSSGDQPFPFLRAGFSRLELFHELQYAAGQDHDAQKLWARAHDPWVWASRRSSLGILQRQVSTLCLCISIQAWARIICNKILRHMYIPIYIGYSAWKTLSGLLGEITWLFIQSLYTIIGLPHYNV